MRLVAICGAALALAFVGTAQAETRAPAKDVSVVVPNAGRDGKPLRVTVRGETVTSETIDGVADELIVTGPRLTGPSGGARTLPGPQISTRGAMNAGVGVNVALPASSNRQLTGSFF